MGKFDLSSPSSFSSVSLISDTILENSYQIHSFGFIKPKFSLLPNVGIAFAVLVCINL